MFEDRTKSIRTKKIEGRIKEQYLGDCMTWWAVVTKEAAPGWRRMKEREATLAQGKSRKCQ